MVVVLTMGRRNSDKICLDAVVCTEHCTPVHLYTITIVLHHPFRNSSFHRPSDSRVPENGLKAAGLLPPSPGLTPPVGQLATPGQPRLDPVQASHEDSLPVQVQYSPSHEDLDTMKERKVSDVLQRPTQLQEPTPSLTGSGRSPFNPLHLWWTLLPGGTR